MDEATWLSSDDPAAMLQFIEERHAPSERKLRLFACASARLLSNPSDYDQACIKVVESLEMQHYDYSQIDPLLGYGPAQWARHHACILRDHEKKAAFLRDIIGNPFRPVEPLWQHRVSLQGQTDKSYPSWLAWNDGIIPKIAASIYESREFDRMFELADALEEAGCTNEEILMHCRGTVKRRVVRKIKTGLLCPLCGQKAFWRHGMHFDHEKRCGDCNVSWEPGEEKQFFADELAQENLIHVRGCWAIDCILGKS